MASSAGDSMTAWGEKLGFCSLPSWFLLQKHWIHVGTACKKGNCSDMGQHLWGKGHMGLEMRMGQRAEGLGCGHGVQSLCQNGLSQASGLQKGLLQMSTPSKSQILQVNQSKIRKHLQSRLERKGCFCVRARLQGKSAWDFPPTFKKSSPQTDLKQ